jgi:SOS response regulatory protein OraA/RecX
MNEDLSRALESLARHLAARDHSELELRQKLRRRFEKDIVDQALNFALERNWLLEPEKLAVRATEEFSRRKKSHRYIQDQLRRRGLPPTAANDDAELTKMRGLLQRKFGSAIDLAYEENAQAFRFLKYRGFQDALIRKVLNEKLDE